MTDLTYRLDDFGRRLEVLEHELAELRTLARPEPGPERIPVAPPPPPPLLPPPLGEPVRRTAKPSPLRPVRPPREIDWSMFFGAKALAWVGGAVTLLGIVFFFVLAVNRGWIGPVARVTLGSLASALVFVAGLYVKRRSAELYHSAVAAVGTGIGGAYMTLLAATVLYGLVPDWAAIVVAGGIAAVAVVTALAWSSELIAGLGLIGAALAPAAVGLQAGDVSAAGTGFAALVFGATAIVAVRQRWAKLAVAGVAATLPQVAVLIAQASPTEWDVVSAAALFWLLYLGTAVAWQERLSSPKLSKLSASLLMLSGVLAGALATAQFEGRAEGSAMLVAAGVYGAVAAALFRVRRHRDLSALAGAVGLALVAIGLADLLSGPTLSVAWAAEAAVLAWLATRIEEPRYQLASIAYLALALGHSLFFDAPPTQLFEATARPAEGAVAFVAVAASAAVVAWYTQGLRRSIIGWAGALSGLYAASLGVLGLAQWISTGAVTPAFQWGHVAVTGLWGVAALAVLMIGHVRRSRELRIGGLIWLGAVALQTFYFDGSELVGDSRGYAFLVGAACLLCGALIDRLAIRDDLSLLASGALAVVSIGFGVAGLYELIGDARAESLALLALAAFYGLVAALVLRRDRDLSTFLWAPALVVAGAASWMLLDGTWLVLAWSVAAAALIGLARLAGERRFEVASLTFYVLALGEALLFVAPLGDLFGANRHPEAGVPALLLVIGAGAVFAWLLDDESLDRNGGTARRAAEAAVAVLCTYAISLTILGVAEAIGGASVTTNFQRGHSVVSAFWGLLGLAVLYVGLKRGLSWLRVVGFGLFGLALAKLFLYDLAFLSSITRAMSFLAVGAVLLVAGFFVQKLSDQKEPSTN
jgi:uncharacterized membrane protein